MIRTFKSFIKNEDGNLLFMTAGFALPLLALAGGALEYCEINKLKNNVQNAADTAVILAFRRPYDSWTLRQKHVNDFFKANLIDKKRLKDLNTKLSYHPENGTTVMTFTINMGVKSLFGKMSPFSASNFTIQATAAYDPETGRAPHLVENPPLTQIAAHSKSHGIR